MGKKKNSLDFDEIEDNHPELIEKIAQEGAERAIKESHALGLETTFIKDGILFRRMPDGTLKEIGEIEQDDLHFEKGTVFYVDK